MNRRRHVPESQPRCRGKHSFTTIRAAKRSISHLRELGDDVRIYRCRWGAHWHVTSEPRRKEVVE